MDGHFQSKFSSKQFSKWIKKERKIRMSFCRQYLPPEVDLSEIQKNDFIDSKVLILDNRDYRIQISSEFLIELMYRFNGENIIEDLFVLPDKKFLILKFISNEFCQLVYNLNFDIQSVNGFNLNFISLSDSLYELIVEKYQPMVDKVFDLFDQKNQPPGLKIYDNFITVSEESNLIKFVQNAFNLAESHGKISKLKSREAIHYGYAFDYAANTIVTDSKQVFAQELPEVFDLIINRFLDFLPVKPDQLTINRYDGSKGDHIPFHCDTHSMCTEWIVSISLNSDVVMSWKNHNNPSKNAYTHLKRRSLMIISDESRYLWDHGICKTVVDIVPVVGVKPNRLSLVPRKCRYSLTFRKSSPSNYICKCFECQSMVNEQESNSTLNAEDLENRFVHETYDQIADHFSSTRYKCWPKVVEFLDSLPDGSLILDVGCGNGRFLSVNPRIIPIGTDRSINLLKICSQRGLETFQDDCLSIDKTIRNEVFDAIISIAVIHHMSTEQRRIRAIHSILNLLAPNGLALIYVWAFNQKLAGAMSKYIKEKSHNEVPEEKSINELLIHHNRTEFRERDMLVPWTKQNNNNVENKYLRYYHLFNEGELEKLINGISRNESRYQIRIEKSYYDEGNWCTVIRKIKI